jgi:energy-coupling factor transport system permease protein
VNFEHKETWLHRVNPSVKLFAFVLYFIAILFIHNINVLINLTYANLFLIIMFSGHPFKRLLLYSSPFLLIFVSSSTAMMFFGEGETTWVRWGLLHITEESFYRGLHIGFRALNFAALGLMFALTTRPVRLFYSLMQQLRLPPKFSYSFMAAIRLIPIMIEEFQTLRQAARVRGGLNGRGLRAAYKKLSFYAIPLLAQSIRRAQRIAVAMEAKRFVSNRQRTYYYIVGFSWYDALYVIVLCGAIACAWWTGTGWPYFDITDVRG